MKNGKKKCQRELPNAKIWHMLAYDMCAWKDYCNCKKNRPTSSNQKKKEEGRKGGKEGGEKERRRRERRDREEGEGIEKAENLKA